MIRRQLLSCALALVTSAALAESEKPGQVQIPLELYNQLIEQTRTPIEPRLPAPMNYALGNAQVSIRVGSTEPRPSAEVTVTLSIQIFENQWSLVPILPPGTPVTQATVQGSVVQLVATPSGLAWATNQKGAFQMDLSYRVDAGSAEGGYVLGLPLPRAASINLTASLPGSGLDVAVIPAAGVRTSTAGNLTQVQATIPTTAGVQISWRTPRRGEPAFSRAIYRGQLSGKAIAWRGELVVELFEDETATLSLLPRDVTLTNLDVDGKPATILVDGKHFATLVRGQGVHRIAVSFETPVERKDGPPHVALKIPKVPVSRIDLKLPGQKEISAEPASSVTSRRRGGATEATVNVPLTSTVTLSWSEAIPEAAREELRANASIFHVIHAEEGVLVAKARVQYEVRRGGTHRLTLELPPEVQVNEVSSESGAIADWRVAAEGSRRILQIFLNRELQGELLFDVDYDRSLSAPRAQVLPLLRAPDVGRQRGMIALLSSRELTLNPADDAGATRVGENQLPGFVRDGIEMTIAHTFKYTDAPPAMNVTASVPERVAGRFDAQVDTLLSLGEVTLTGSVTTEIHVKSGGVDTLELVLPEGASLLNLNAPSLRTHRVSDDESPVVTLEFTQEMEGDFKIELTYERILDEGEAVVAAATPRVREADVEQGRIAVEASSAAEVAPAETAELSPIDVSELPRQLVLRTTNPILLAFKYVRAEPAPRLSLQVRRHPTMDVQEAAIDLAEYRTLFTRDGLSVTSAYFTVRNARKQFLKVRLPESSELWSVFVAGRAEKPALAEQDGARFLLVPIVNRTEGFPVEVVYASRGNAIGRLGTVRARLPRPDILVTRSQWNLYLPEGLDYHQPSTNMDVVTPGRALSEQEMRSELATLSDTAEISGVAEPLLIHVPTTGVRYGLEKLYANQGDVEAYVAIPYASSSGAMMGQLVCMLGVGLVWLAGWIWWTGDEGASATPRIVLALAGGVSVVVASGIYHVSLVPSLLLSLAAAAFLFRSHLRRLAESVRPERPVELG
jgi:hypothetical protein